MLEEISILFGGRIAEEVVMGQMSTGASNDFERATKLARDMVTRYGMSDSLGTMVYVDTEQDGYMGKMSAKSVSEATQQKVDGEIRRILDEQYALARRLIETNRDKLDAMAKALLEWETIDADQINDIMAGQPPRPPKAAAPTNPPTVQTTTPVVLVTIVTNIVAPTNPVVRTNAVVSPPENSDAGGKKPMVIGAVLLVVAGLLTGVVAFRMRRSDHGSLITRSMNRKK